MANVSFGRLRDHKCFPTYCILIVFGGNFPKTMIGLSVGLGDGGSVQVRPTSTLLGPLNVASIVGTRMGHTFSVYCWSFVIHAYSNMIC